MYYNYEQYDVSQYGDKTIIRESQIIKQEVNKNQPKYFEFFIESYELLDNSNYLQLFGPTQTFFYNHNT